MKTAAILWPLILSVACSSSSDAQVYFNFRNFDTTLLNSDNHSVRTVFKLPKERMSSTPLGANLKFDVVADAGPFNYTYRSELRETNNQTFPVIGSSQVYHIRFRANQLPNLYGPVTIFQRFNRENDGPDIEVELTGANQFGDATPNEIQIVNFAGDRIRLKGKFLQPINDLVVVIFNAADGKYKISLNGETLHQVDHINTIGSEDGTWVQFGLYPHGLHDANNRQDQIDSHETQFDFTYESFSKTEYKHEVDLENFDSRNDNPIEIELATPIPQP